VVFFRKIPERYIQTDCDLLLLTIHSHLPETTQSDNWIAAGLIRKLLIVSKLQLLFKFREEFRTENVIN
jgi:hypothetical protein